MSLPVLSPFTCTHGAPCLCERRTAPEPARSPFFVRVDLTRLILREPAAAMLTAWTRFARQPRLNRWKPTGRPA